MIAWIHKLLVAESLGFFAKEVSMGVLRLFDIPQTELWARKADVESSA